MSYYRAEDVIRLSRNALGMTQEELIGDICSIKTLNRIEHGKTGIKKDTYQRLMARMQRIPEKIYAVSSDEELDILEYQVEVDDAIRRHDYPKADFYLKKMEAEVAASVLSRQYIDRERAIIEYCCRRLDKKEYVLRLEAVIQLTIPDYRAYIETTYPFTEQEMNTLLSLAIAYKEINETVFAIQILDMLLRSLKKGYMDTECAHELEITINYNRARMYGFLEEYTKAIKICESNLEMSACYHYEAHMPDILLNLAWQMIQQIKIGQRRKEELSVCKQYLLQSYYLADAVNRTKQMIIVKAYYKKEFNVGIDPSQEALHQEH